MSEDDVIRSLAEQYPEYVFVDGNGEKHFDIRQLMIDRGYING